MAGIISDHQLWGLRKALRRGLMVVADLYSYIYGPPHNSNALTVKDYSGINSYKLLGI